MIPEQVIVVFSTRPVFSVTPCVVGRGQQVRTLIRAVVFG